MADILSTINTRVTSQKESARPEQIKNAAGGYAFQVGDSERLRRFLILGTEGGSYYTTAADLTKDNAQVVFRMVANQPDETIQTIVDISTNGRAPNVKPAIFALAIAASADDVETRRKALAMLSQVCRTATHLYLFNKYVEQFRGRGRALNTAIAKWYTDPDVMPVGKLAHQIVKYRAREDWSHRDVLRKVRPVGVDDRARRIALNFAVGKGLNDYAYRVDGVTREQWLALSPSEKKATHERELRAKLSRVEEVPDDVAIIADFEDAQHATTALEWVEIIGRGHGLTWEMLPDAAMNLTPVWEALLANKGVPIGALIRQLSRLTNLGLCDGETGREICARLTDPVILKKGRIHPINMLVAARTYAQGHGEMGNLRWDPRSNISGALSAGFPAAYGSVEPSGKRTLVAVDWSGSMWSARIPAGLDRRGYQKVMPINPAEAACAIATVTGATEQDVTHVAFTTHAWRLDIAGRRLDDVLTYCRQTSRGEGTDCALPMMFAMEFGLKVDTFILMTDGETWAGRMHPFQALEMYRQKTGINAKLVAAAMTSTRTSINRPDDPLTLDVVGFDTAVPQMAADFSAGRI
jgi:60 kDa SS-A/Ro ribonucleoprotein